MLRVIRILTVRLLFLFEAVIFTRQLPESRREALHDIVEAGVLAGLQHFIQDFQIVLQSIPLFLQIPLQRQPLHQLLISRDAESLVIEFLDTIILLVFSCEDQIARRQALHLDTDILQPFFMIHLHMFYETFDVLHGHSPFSLARQPPSQACGFSARAIYWPGTRLFININYQCAEINLFHYKNRKPSPILQILPYSFELPLLSF